MPPVQGSSGYKDLPYPEPTSQAASATMRANRRTGTEPEARIRSALHRRGYRFRKDFSFVLGRRRVSSDIVFTRCKLAVFIDGCFWHKCSRHGAIPASNPDYWVPKLARTVERDRRVDESLAQFGWSVLHIWEHVSLTDAVAKIENFLSPR